MTSPFPGMDPYLEVHWGDVHARLITYACDQIQLQLPRDLRARMEERLLVIPPEADPREVFPDVRVVERTPLGRGGAAVAVAVAEPVVVYREEGVRETFIQIVEAQSLDRVITVIEILSPSNKRPGRDMDKYVQKREERYQAKVNMVEIDLLRTGRRELGDPFLAIPPKGFATYQACIHRAAHRLVYEIYPLPLRASLPRLRIPLRPTDTEITLDLQAIVDQCYLNGRYDDLDYSVAPVPPLDTADAAWADALLREKGRR